MGPESGGGYYVVSILSTMYSAYTQIIINGKKELYLQCKVLYIYLSLHTSLIHRLK
jgi:hypothetical protein